MYPEVSVILPYFNAELTLQRAISSILEQSFTHFELLLINNNSTDKSADIARQAAQNDSRIVLLDEKIPGVANAMNCGLKNARGRFISRMDADDVAHSEKLQKQYNYLENNPIIDFFRQRSRICPSHRRK